VFGAAKRAQLCFQFGDFGTHNEFALVDDAQHRLVDPPAEAPPLRAQIDELDRRLRSWQDRNIGHHAISSIRSAPASR